MDDRAALPQGARMRHQVNDLPSSNLASRTGALRIADVEAYCLERVVPQGTSSARQELCLIRVVTECGRHGWGEAHSSASVVCAAINAPKTHDRAQGLALLLKGEAIDDPRRLWRRMYEGTSWIGRDGPVLHAMAGVDIALWDLLSQARGEPMWRSLRDLSNYDQPAMPMPTYASGEAAPTPRATAERLKLDLLAGFRDVKIGGAPFGEALENDLACLEVARAVIGHKARLMVDVAQIWDAETTIARSKAFRPFELTWIEEPLSRDDLEGQASLTGLRIPIAAGKAEAALPAFQRLMNTEGVDILQINVSRVGPTMGIAVALEASRRGIMVATHSQTAAVNLQASLHFLNAIPNALTLEYPRLQLAIWGDLAAPPGLNAAGLVPPPAAPGLGLVPHEAVMRQSRMA
jgi:L-rhamnonate dehydratase